MPKTFLAFLNLRIFSSEELLDEPLDEEPDELDELPEELDELPDDELDDDFLPSFLGLSPDLSWFLLREAVGLGPTGFLTLVKFICLVSGLGLVPLVGGAGVLDFDFDFEAEAEEELEEEDEEDFFCLDFGLVDWFWLPATFFGGDLLESELELF